MASEREAEVDAQRRGEGVSAKPKDPLTKMDHNQFVDWAIGELVLSIGRGEIRSVIFKILLTHQRWCKLHVPSFQGKVTK